jgi:succinate dehydrogenase / fumarate reductase membrane anchor subunit
VRDWLAQRFTAVVMALYTLVLLVTFLTSRDFSYEGWAGMFAQQWFKMATFVAFIALFYHAWVGVRDILMDYVTSSVVLRLALQVATIVWLVGCAGWAVQIIWRV